MRIWCVYTEICFDWHASSKRRFASWMSQRFWIWSPTTSVEYWTSTTESSYKTTLNLLRWIFPESSDDVHCSVLCLFLSGRVNKLTCVWYCRCVPVAHSSAKAIRTSVCISLSLATCVFFKQCLKRAWTTREKYVVICVSFPNLLKVINGSIQGSFTWDQARNLWESTHSEGLKWEIEGMSCFAI